MLALRSNPMLFYAVRGAVERLSETLGFPEAQRRSIARAVDEALTNIARHSYNNRPDEPVTLYFRRTQRDLHGTVQKGLEILLCDRGPAVDPSKLRGQPLEEIRPGGLGLHFMREAMDTVEFLRKGSTNRTRLVKYLAQTNDTPGGIHTVQISVRHLDKTTIFDVSGDVDFANSPELRQLLLREIQENHTQRVALNLGEVRYIDSSGIASLVEALKASRDLGSHFILFGLGESAREALQLSRLVKVFEVYDNEVQALAS